MTTATRQKTQGTPHDKFGRKTLGDPLIAADLLRFYGDANVAKDIELDKLKPVSTKFFQAYSSIVNAPKA